MGLTAEEFLIRGGYVGELGFYRALAAELGLPFLSAPRLSPGATYPDSILAGLAPLAGPGQGFVMAPRGAALPQILGTRRQPDGLLAITAPSLLARATFRARAKAIAWRAANDLPERAAALSSRDGATPAQIAALAASAFLASFIGGLAPALAFGCIGVALTPLFLGLVVMRLAAAILNHPVKPSVPLPRIDDAALPVYTVIIALYREKRVVPRLIAALSKLDYPPAKLDIKLVLETDDRETMNALAGIDIPAHVEIIVAPPGGPRTKPRALNVALPLARGHVTVIYDADDVPERDQLRLAAATFARLPQDVACLQARLAIDNTDDSWLTQLFTIEYAALFDVFNPALAEIGCPIPLGGTSNHFRTSVLRKVRGWDAWNVTEDADLGIRLARLGYHVGDLPSSTYEEAPSTLRGWMRQRTRWMKGFVQTCVTHSRHPTKVLSQLGVWRFFGAVSVTLGTVLSALGFPFLTALFVALWIRGPVPAPGWERLLYSTSLTLFTLGAAAMIIPACTALHRRRLWRLLPWIPLLPAYYCLVSIAAWRSLWELVAAPFHWNKTSHGLARTSRTGLLQKHQARPARTISLKTEPP